MQYAKPALIDYKVNHRHKAEQNKKKVDWVNIALLILLLVVIILFFWK